MKKGFYLLLFFLLLSLSLFSLKENVLAVDTQCVIKAPSEIVAGENFTVIISLPKGSYGSNVTWFLNAYGTNPTALGKQKGALPQSFQTKIQTPGTYNLIAMGTTGDTQSTGVVGTCSLANLVVKPSPNTPVDATPTPTPCWTINSAIQPGQPNTCINMCNAGTGLGGQYQTEEECTKSIPQAKEGQACKPGDAFGCAVGTYCKPIGENWICAKGASSTPYDPTLPCVGGGACPTVNTAIGPISTRATNFISDLFKILLGISGGIAIVLIISSGYKIMTSQGEAEKIKEAREGLTSAIVGLLFIIFSLVILQIIGADILKIPGFTP